MIRIDEAAELRRQAWLVVHGVHEWEKHSLAKDALEEAVDGWTYCQAALAGFNGSLTGYRKRALITASNYFELAYNKLNTLNEDT